MRVPISFGDLTRDPNVENYPFVVLIMRPEGG